MKVEFATPEFQDARGYYTEDEITIVLDNLMRRKNEKIKYVAKRITTIFLQEFLCRESCKIIEVKCYWEGNYTCPFFRVVNNVDILS